MRKYPPVGFIPRLCTKEYKVPNSNLVIEKGTQLMISVFGIHRDPARYADPDKFDPSRFSPEEIPKRSKFDFLAFGEGYRGCFGKNKRFVSWFHKCPSNFILIAAQELAHLKVAMGLAVILAKLNVELIKPVDSNLEFDSKRYVLFVNGGIHLRVSRRIFDN